jgi:hypothetical protein
MGPCYEAFIAMCSVMRVIDDRVDAIQDVTRLAEAERMEIFRSAVPTGGSDERWFDVVESAFVGRTQPPLSQACPPCTAGSTSSARRPPNLDSFRGRVGLPVGGDGVVLDETGEGVPGHPLRLRKQPA